MAPRTSPGWSPPTCWHRRCRHPCGESSATSTGGRSSFRAAIVLFLVGSALTGLSHSMFELIVFRALQGLGGGGLMVGSMTIVGDVVSPRERGRYMGLFMAMFGVTSLLGPLIGGFFVDYLSWRWIFYINMPIGAVALVVTTVALPGALSRVHRVIDYLGTALIASVGHLPWCCSPASGGTSFPWTSPFMIGLAVAGVVFAVLFLWAERRATEPIIPLASVRQPGVQRGQRHRLRGRVRHVRLPDLPAPVLPGGEGGQPDRVGVAAVPDDGRAAGRPRSVRVSWSAGGAATRSSRWWARR